MRALPSRPANTTTLEFRASGYQFGVWRGDLIQPIADKLYNMKKLFFLCSGERKVYTSETLLCLYSEVLLNSHPSHPPPLGPHHFSCRQTFSFATRLQCIFHAPDWYHEKAILSMLLLCPKPHGSAGFPKCT